MKPEELRRLFVESGALLSGHFKLSSGLHSGQYFQCALVLADTGRAERIGRALAALAPAGAETVLAPALGGVVIGHEVARALKARSLFAERQDGVMTMRRGFSLRPGEKVLVVEDVITTGKSTGEVVKLVEAAGASCVGAVSIVLRAASDPDLGVPLASLARLPAESFEPASCPLCAKGLPVVKPGSRPGA